MQTKVILGSPAPVFARPGATERPKSSSTPDKTADTIARRLIFFRHHLGLTQAQVAKKAGLSETTVNEAESGQSQITIKTLQRLSVALETKPGVLLGCMDPPAEILREDARRRRF